MITTIEQKITDLISQTVKDLGFEIVKLSVKGSGLKVLEILIDKLNDEKVSVEDCKKISRDISALLDVENIFEAKYNLEVSSAGIERPLVSLENYTKFIGNEVQIRLKELLNNCSHYRGTIMATENNIISLKLKKNDQELSIPFSLIKNGHLVLTEQMFKKLLSKKN